MQERIEELEQELSTARNLLYDAQNLLDNIHGYDYDTYREISKFLNGEGAD